MAKKVSIKNSSGESQIVFLKKPAEKPKGMSFRVPAELQARTQAVAKLVESAGLEINWSEVVRLALEKACNVAEQQIAAMQSPANAPAQHAA